jgi:hypothetical protein
MCEITWSKLCELTSDFWIWHLDVFCLDLLVIPGNGKQMQWCIVLLDDAVIVPDHLQLGSDWRKIQCLFFTPSLFLQVAQCGISK